MTRNRLEGAAMTATARLLAEHPDYHEPLARINDFEHWLGHPWAWSGVGVDPRSLTVMVFAGVLRHEGRERGRWLYRLVDRDETRRALEAVRRAR